MKTRSPIPLDYAAPTPDRWLKVRFAAWVVTVVGLLSTYGCWLLNWPEEIGAWSFLSDRHWWPWCWCACGLVIGTLCILLATTPVKAIRLAPRLSTCLIVGVTATLQIAFIVRVPPILSEEVVRYRLDGAIWLAGESPYAMEPLVYFHSAQPYGWDKPRYVVDELDRSVQFPLLCSIDQPVAQLSFIAGRWLGDRMSSLPLNFVLLRTRLRFATERDYATLAFRLVFSGASLVCTLVLIAVLKGTGRSAWWATLFAWNPVTVVECGVMTHVDVLGVMLVLLALHAIVASRPVWSAAMLALACGVLPVALVLVPWLVRDARKLDGSRPIYATLVAFLTCLALVYVPALSYHDGYRGPVRSAREYSKHAEFTGPAYESVTALIEHLDDGRSIDRAKSVTWLLLLAAVVFTAIIL